MIFYPVIFVVVVPVPVYVGNHFCRTDEIQDRPIKRAIGFLANHSVPVPGRLV